MYYQSIAENAGGQKKVHVVLEGFLVFIILTIVFDLGLVIVCHKVSAH